MGISFRLRSIYTFLVLVLASTNPSLAADYNPGDGCSASGALHTANDIDGVNVLVCNGTTWEAAISYHSSGGISISTLSGYPAPSVTGSISNIDDLSDVDTTGKGLNDVLTWDGATWGAAPSGAGGSGLWTDGTGDAIYYNSGTPLVGIGLSNPSVTLDVEGDIQFTGTITDVSDRRLKEDIIPLSGSSIGIATLTGYSFTMKNDPDSSIEYGLIAQEVEEVFPELVITKPDGTKTMNYLGMIAPLVEAVKDQQAQIDALKSEIQTLQSSRAPNSDSGKR